MLYPFCATLDVSSNHIYSLTKGTFSLLSNLLYLDVRKNQISVLVAGFLDGLIKLREIFLTQNPILTIEPNSFTSNVGIFADMKDLDLSGLKLQQLDNGVFNGLKLNKLNISFNSINCIEYNVFKLFPQLEKLDVRENSLSPWAWISFQPLQNLNYFAGDDVIFCCHLHWLRDDNCFSSRGNIFSSCSDFVTDGSIRICLWIFLCITWFGGAFALFSYLKNKSDIRHDEVFYEIMLISSIGMSIYTLFTSAFDVYYRGKYIDHDYHFRTGYTCIIIGAIATVSFYMIVFTSFFYSLKPFLNQQINSSKYIYSSCILALSIALTISIICTQSGYHILSSTSACLSIPHISTFHTDMSIDNVTIISLHSTICFVILTIILLRIRPIAKNKQTSSMWENIVLVTVRWQVFTLLCFLTAGYYHIYSSKGLSPSSQLWFAWFVFPLFSINLPVVYMCYTWYYTKKMKVNPTIVKSSAMSAADNRINIWDNPDTLVNGLMSEKTSMLLLSNRHGIYKTLRAYTDETNGIKMKQLLMIVRSVCFALDQIELRGLKVGAFSDDTIQLYISKEVCIISI